MVQIWRFWPPTGCTVTIRSYFRVGKRRQRRGEPDTITIEYKATGIVVFTLYLVACTSPGRFMSARINSQVLTTIRGPHISREILSFPCSECAHVKYRNECARDTETLREISVTTKHLRLPRASKSSGTLVSYKYSRRATGID